jgi:NTP pyrophosphatase (non-canonical NTP hydrolase)
MSLSLAEIQHQIKATFGARDAQRGVEGSFMWFMEEVGELSAALRKGDRAALAPEFADVLAWLATLANNAGIDLGSAFAAKYGQGCPRCDRTPCACSIADKP